MKTFFLSFCCLSTVLLANGQSVSLDLKTKASLKSELDSIFTMDQKYRLMMDSVANRFGQESKQMKELWKITDEIDSKNLDRVTHILDKYGWLGPDEIGGKASSTLWVVVQHADQKTQEKYLPMMREAVSRGKARGSSLALLEDRVALRQGKKQIYGTQVGTDSETGNHYIMPIEDEPNVNKRRKAVELPPLEVYAKQWNIEYTLPKK